MDRTASPIKSYEMKDLFSQEEIERFDQSSSSIWWHKGAPTSRRSEGMFISLE